MVIQKYLFAKSKGWTMAKAQEWIKANKKSVDDNLSAYVETLDFEPVEKAPPWKYCVCPECGYSEEKEAAKPCQDIECPECGVKLVPSNKKPEKDFMEFVQEHELLEGIGDVPTVKGAIPYKKESLADEDMEWDAGKARSQSDTVEKRRRISAWVDSDDADNLTAYKYSHHYAAENFQVVWYGVASGMARLMQNPQQKDRPGIHKHFAGHYKDFGKEVPELKYFESVNDLYKEDGMDPTTKWFVLVEMMQTRADPIHDLTEFYADIAHERYKGQFDSLKEHAEGLERVKKAIGYPSASTVEETVEKVCQIIEAKKPEIEMMELDDVYKKLQKMLGPEAAGVLMATKIGAVLNRKNKSRIFNAIKELQAVLEDSSPAEEQEKGMTAENEPGGEEVDLDSIEKTLEDRNEVSKEDLEKVSKELLEEFGQKIEDVLDKARGKIKF